MRVYVERTGGFAGMKLEGFLDSANLPVSQARRLEQLLRKSDFFNLPPVISGKPAPDRFSYKVTVETEHRKHTVEANEAAIPGTVRPLLDFLTRSIQPRSK